jgi:hypothetical protein
VGAIGIAGGNEQVPALLSALLNCLAGTRADPIGLSRSEQQQGRRQMRLPFAAAILAMAASGLRRRSYDAGHPLGAGEFPQPPNQ